MLDVFLMIRWGSGFGRKTTKVQSHLYPILLWVHPINRTWHCGSWPYFLAKVVSLCFSAEKLHIWPCPIEILEGSPYAQPTLKWGIVLHFLEGRRSTWIIWNSFAKEITTSPNDCYFFYIRTTLYYWNKPHLIINYWFHLLLSC